MKRGIINTIIIAVIIVFLSGCGEPNYYYRSTNYNDRYYRHDDRYDRYNNNHYYGPRYYRGHRRYYSSPGVELRIHN